MSQIPVYILSHDSNSPRANQVQSLFFHPLFLVNIVSISPPPGLQETPTLSLGDALEAYRISWCLNHAREKYPDKYVIIVKDTSVSSASADTIAEIISAAVTAKDWQVCYLCRWRDQCNLYSDKRPIEGTSSLLVKTKSPHGTQAIMFSPSGREIILGHAPMKNSQTFTPITKPFEVQLNEAIANDWIDATCIVPNLIEYDITAAKSPDDYLKTHDCVPPPTPVPEPPVMNRQYQQNGISLWWFLLLIIIVLVILWLAARKSNFLSLR